MLHLVFGIIAAATLGCGLMAVTSRRLVHSVLWLILAFFNAAGLMILIGAEFIAMLLVIVYVGAVAVLFLFVVMMLDIDFAQLRAGFIKNFPLGFALAFVFLAELVMGVGAYKAGGLVLGTPDAATAPIAGLSNTAAIGALLYSRYLFLFETAGIILLVAMIGAIVLTHRQRGDVRGQKPGSQISRRPEEATINLQPEVGKGVTL